MSVNTPINSTSTSEPLEPERSDLENLIALNWDTSIIPVNTCLYSKCSLNEIFFVAIQLQDNDYIVMGYEYIQKFGIYSDTFFTYFDDIYSMTYQEIEKFLVDCLNEMQKV